MKSTCAEIEILLCDYADGALPAAEQARVSQHLAECAVCAEQAADAGAAAAFLRRAPRPEPPPELITRILFETLHADSPPARAARPGPATAIDRLLNRLHALIQPVLQPRLAMGMAMTILSFSMIGRFAGVTGSRITPADLDPVKIWVALDLKAHRTWERAVKYYENLRVVYEIQNTLNEWSVQEEEDLRSQQMIEPNRTDAAGPRERSSSANTGQEGDEMNVLSPSAR